MSLDNFKDLLDQLKWLKMLNLWHRGEPLVAPDFPEMVALASERGIKTITHTNGILLSRQDRAERLVKARLTRISIGLDSASEDGYAKIRKGGSLRDVILGAEALLQARLKHNTRYPRIEAECLVSNQPVAELHAVRELARKIGFDAFRFKTYRVCHPGNLEASLAELPENRRLWRYILQDGKLVMNRTREHCLRLGYSAVVAYNGDVLPCCFDAQARFTFGNAFREPFQDIWNGALAKDFQKTINSGNRDACPICRNCTEGLKRLYLPEKWVCN